MTPLQKKIKAFKTRLKRSEKEVDKQITNILNANKSYLIELNTSQLVEGKDSHGDSMGTTIPYRSAKYATYKHQINPLPGLGVPDLRLTGDYWDSIRAIIKARQVQMIATDSKASQLARYEAIGLAPESYPEVSNLLRRKLNFKRIIHA